MKKRLAILLCTCMITSLFVYCVSAQQEAAVENVVEEVSDEAHKEISAEGTEEKAPLTEESEAKNENSVFHVSASEAFDNVEPKDSVTVNKNVEIDGFAALEITNNYSDGDFERIVVDMSGYDFPKDIMQESKFVSVKYKYVPPEGTVVKKGKMTLVLIVGRDKTVISNAVNSEEKVVAGGWTTAVFDLEKFASYSSGRIEQMYLYPFGYYDNKLMSGLSEKMYIGDVSFHETAPDVEEVVQEDTSGKTVVGQKKKSGFSKVTKDLFSGLGMTLMLFCLTLLFALPLGLIISLGAICKFKIIKLPIKVFVWVIRGTPLMLQLMLFFYGPGLLGLTALNNFTAALIAFVINYACYFSEIFRGGIESIPKGQYEAGRVLGLTKVQVFFKIVLMQVVKNILPPMSNEFLTLVKDTALANTITVVEITWIAKRFTSEGLLWPLFYSGVFYLAVCGILTVVFNRIEKKLDYYKI